MPYLRVSQQLTLRHTRKVDYFITRHDVFEADETAQVVIGLCDGTRRREQMVIELAERYGIALEEVAEALDPFVEEMERQGVLEWREQPVPIRPIYHPGRPSSITLELTNACNEHCVYCINRAGRRLPDELGDKEVDHLLDELIELQVSPVNLSGGEPLLRSSLVLHAISRLSKAGLEPHLLTNATLVTPDLACALHAAGLRSAQVSIDSLEPGVYDQHRGRQGALQPALKGMQALHKAGIEITAAVVITSRNYHLLQDIYHWITQQGYTPKIGLVAPIGRGADPKLLLSPAQVLGFRKYMATGSAESDGPLGMMVLCRETCSIGTSPVVGPTGDVYPCYLTRLDEFYLGNMRQQSLQEIWTTSPLLHELMGWNVDQLEGCQDCWNKLFCGGGCRGQAYFYHHTIYAPDLYTCAANQALAREILHHGHPSTQAALEELIALTGCGERLLNLADVQAISQEIVYG